MLGLMMVLGLMGCDPNGNNEETKVVAEQYRGHWEMDDNGYVMCVEITEKTAIYSDGTVPAWTVDNKFWTHQNNNSSHIGTFTNNDTLDCRPVGGWHIYLRVPSCTQ